MSCRFGYLIISSATLVVILTLLLSFWQWDPKLPGIFASASFDGHVAIHNILQCTGSDLTDVVNEDFSVSHIPKGPSRPLRFVPKWLARPAGAAFGEIILLLHCY